MDNPGTPANHCDVPCAHLPDHEPGACRPPELPDLTAGHARRPARDMLVPFVVQAGPRVYMLAAEDDAWVLAEMTFDQERVAFIETRRSSYEWPREAFGALLSRVALREADDATVEEVALDFGRWLGGQFVGH